MDEWKALHKLRAAGYDFYEAYRLLWFVREERATPSSRAKANKYKRVEAVLRELGIEPTEIRFSPNSYGSEEWIQARK